MIEVAYKVTKAEFIQAGLKFGSRRRVLSIIRTLAIGIVWACTLLSLLSGQYVTSGFLIALSILVPLFPRFVLMSNYRGASLLHSQLSTKIDGTGVVTMYETGSHEFTWKGVEAAFETRDTMCLCLSTSFMRIFPKRAFTTEQLMEFRKLLEENNLSLGKR